MRGSSNIGRRCSGRQIIDTQICAEDNVAQDIAHLGAEIDRIKVKAVIVRVCSRCPVRAVIPRSVELIGNPDKRRNVCGAGVVAEACGHVGSVEF